MKIVLDELTKIYPSRDKKSNAKVVALDHFSLEIPDGTLVGLLGPSGCGKSTTLNMISGLEELTSGKIYFGDEDVTEFPPEKRGIGLVFQNYALYPHLTAKQNITFPLENLRGKEKLTKAEINDRALEVANLVQITEYLSRKPSQMSGGQQQRVAIARALVKKPKVLLLDEPLSNLDARLRLQTREEIRRIQKETKITTIFVTHDQEEAMSICDIIVVMNKGAIMQTGAPQEVYDNPDNLFVAKFLGTPPINVFEGRVVDEKLYIGDEVVHDTAGVENQEVYVGIRPEGFVYNLSGKLTCKMKYIEVMGRDTSIVSLHDCAQNTNIRSIVSSETVIEKSETVKFDIKSNKMYIFNKETEKRIYLK